MPDTARTSALEVARVLGIAYREGFIKNRYVGRTFIMPQQGLRKKSVRQKLSPIYSEFAGRNVLLVDDSIVRGTTSKEIIEMARDAGAKQVYMASAAPPVRFPNIYGIDMPTKAELIANKVAPDSDLCKYEESLCDVIGADRVFYQDIDDLRNSIYEEAKAVGVKIDQLDMSCFDGNYVTSGADSAYFNNLAETRASSRGKASSSMNILDQLESGKKQRRS